MEGDVARTLRGSIGSAASLRTSWGRRSRSMLLHVHRDRTDYISRDGEPTTSTSTFTVSPSVLLYVHRECIMSSSVLLHVHRECIMSSSVLLYVHRECIMSSSVLLYVHRDRNDSTQLLSSVGDRNLPQGFAEVLNPCTYILYELLLQMFG